MKFVQAFFGSLPTGTGFWHRNGWFVKTGEEEAYRIKGKRELFEVHYGCVISGDLAEALQLQQEDFRDDGPIPDDSGYTEKLFGLPLGKRGPRCPICGPVARCAGRRPGHIRSGRY